MAIKSFATLLVTFAIIALTTIPASASPASDKLQAFIEKLKATQSKNNAGTALDRDSENGGTLAQLQMLQAWFVRGDSEKPKQMMESMPFYGFPPDIQQEWIGLTAELMKELRQRETEAQEKFRAEVDQLINDVHKGCLQATKSADLDPLLLRCAALQMRRSNTSDILSNRTTQKLAGAVDTLQAFTKFMDFSAAGKVEAANRALEDLINNAANSPVLTVNEIKGRMAGDDEHPANLPLAIANLTSNAKTPDDLDRAIERAKKLIGNATDSSSRNYRPDLDGVGALATTWADAKAGNDDVALRNLSNIPRPGPASPLASFHTAVSNAIARRIMEHKLRAYTSALPWSADQPLAEYFDKLLTSLQEKQDFPGMIEVLKLVTRLPDAYGMRSSDTGEQQRALEKFLSAQRFESAGDAISAVADYRTVVEAGGKFSPVKLATDALAKLQQAHPEIFKDYEGAVLQEIHALREQLRNTPSNWGRGPGGPFMPGR